MVVIFEGFVMVVIQLTLFNFVVLSFGRFRCFVGFGLFTVVSFGSL